MLSPTGEWTVCARTQPTGKERWETCELAPTRQSSRVMGPDGALLSVLCADKDRMGWGQFPHREEAKA